MRLIASMTVFFLATVLAAHEIPRTWSNRPPCSAGQDGPTFLLLDPVDALDCSAGGGTAQVHHCTCDNGTWKRTEPDDGHLHTGATLSAIDWDDLIDAMTLDATTSIDMDTNNADFNFDSDTVFIDSSANRIGFGTDAPTVILHAKDNAASVQTYVENTQANSMAGYVMGNDAQDVVLRVEGNDDFVIRDVTYLKSIVRVQPNALAEAVNITSGSVIVNETGIDADLRVESDTKTHAFFLQGSDGFMGVNDATPLRQVWVTGSIAGQGRVAVNETPTGGANIPGFDLFNEGVYQGGLYYFETDDSVRLYNGLIAAITLDSSGNVGINNTSPARALHITDVMRLEPRSTAPSSPSSGDIYVDSTGNQALCVYLNGAWVVAGGTGSCA